LKKLLKNPLDSGSMVAILSLFLLTFLAANRLHHALCGHDFQILCVPYWPISIVMPRIPPDIGYPNLLHLLVAGVSMLLFGLALSILRLSKYKISLAILFGVLILLTTTLTHGWQFGLVRPIAGMGVAQHGYYNEALKIDDPGRFLKEFALLQPDLFVHSQTHPPYAVLTFYFLKELWKDPALIAIALAVISLSLTSLFYAKLLMPWFGSSLTGKILFIFMLIPAVQIYYLASLDSLLAALLLGSLLFLFSDSRGAWFVSILCTLLASMLSFGFLFILPLILAFELWTRREVRRTIAVVSNLILVHLGFYYLSGFSYLKTFFTAAAIENPGGFSMLVAPANYFMTRIEDVAEVFLFLGPFLFLLMVRGISRDFGKSPLMRISILGIAVFLLMLLSGAYRTGETARAAIFIYPFLMIPAGFEMKAMQIDGSDYAKLARLVFAQSLIMQLLGDYYW
jgi:hypothetical protein